MPAYYQIRTKPILVGFPSLPMFFLSGRLVSQTELYVNYNLLRGFKLGPAAKLENQQDSNSWRGQLYLVSISNLGM